MTRGHTCVTIAVALLAGIGLLGQEQVADPPARPSRELCAQADSLNRAVQRGCADRVRELLAANGIDSKNGSESEALRTAIRTGNREIVELLVKAGASVNPSL